ncbi:hypothetical protein O983_15320 [Mycobacterium avium 09-5983]|jgi:hypothetical protein|nr:hypothetical protein O984_06755 [Mycobacterium avium 05-4293]ETB23458.1 hypothetical protein O983_15320 [Mycobacterium avium 09-5983]ETB27965.1 hypothetical protein O971_15730 [Mycobacterium avium subsp. hominissuis 10-4249]ETB40445.1 hypothetical protein N602_12870 [Mycobacterium avium subsp. hominissuis 10-5606]ETB51484.1 hypothetical protein O981_16595 [Mycobacterium avium 10-5560]KBR58681.1 hypothetical protein X425_04106 [Mycobacterium avium XTB13-223]
MPPRLPIRRRPRRNGSTIESVATWYDVARIVGELALTSEPSPHDWRVGKKLLAWERPLRPSEREALARTGAEPAPGDVLGVRVADEGVKFALIDDAPQTFFTTPHFDGYPAVLVNLAAISVRDLEELITEAWLTQAPRKLVQEFLADSR